jgi:hypothetical protein
MSVTDIIQELPKLSPEDRNLLRLELEERYLQDFEETPEMLAAIDEGLRSSKEERSYTLEEAREELRKWHSDSK